MKKVLQCMHVHDSFMHELLSLNIEQKQVVEDITDRIVEVEKALDSLKVTVDNIDTDIGHKQN